MATQWTGGTSNPMPVWQDWGAENGGWGYAPNPGPAAGSNNPVPGGNIFTPLEDIEAAQAANYAAQNPTAPPPTTSTPSTPKPSAPAPTTTQTSTLRQPQSMESKLAVPSPGPGWVRTASGDWVPPDHPLAKGPLYNAGATGSGTSSGGSTGGAPAAGGMSSYDQILNMLANAGGKPNMPALQLRLEGARENLEGTRKSQSQSLMSQLSDLGLFGDGDMLRGLGGIEEDLAGEYGRSANAIYADEYNRADDRMMQALSLLTGRDDQNLDREVDWFSARSNDRIGNRQAGASEKSAGADMLRAQSDQKRIALEKQALALQKLGLQNNYSLGLGGLQNDADSNFLRSLLSPLE